MRNYEFLSIEDKDKLINIKNAMQYRVEKHCKDALSSHELEKICETIDISRQYKIVATSNKKFFENLVYGGYAVIQDDSDKDLITRYSVFTLLGSLNLGYSRRGKLIYPTRVLTNRCVACVQDTTMGCDNGFVRESRFVLYIYIGKSDCSEVR